MFVRVPSQESCATWKNCRRTRSHFLETSCRTRTTKIFVSESYQSANEFRGESVPWRDANVSLHSNSQHFVPFALVFEHDFAEEPNGRHAVVEQLVVEFLQ